MFLQVSCGKWEIETMKVRLLFVWLLVGFISFPVFSDKPTGASIDLNRFYYSLPTVILSFNVISDISEVSSYTTIKEIVQSLKSSLPNKTIAVARQFAEEMEGNGLDVNLGMDIVLAADTPILAPAKAFVEAHRL